MHQLPPLPQGHRPGAGDWPLYCYPDLLRCVLDPWLHGFSHLRDGVFHRLLHHLHPRIKQAAGFCALGLERFHPCCDWCFALPHHLPHRCHSPQGRSWDRSWGLWAPGRHPVCI